jgi:hypothetical protein
MADTLTASISLKFIATLANAVQSASAGVPIDSSTLFSGLAFTDGTTSGKADKVWFCEGRTLTGTTPEDLDLYDFGSIDIGGGAGKDPLGGALALAEICAMFVYNRSTSTGNIFFGGKNAGTAWNSCLAVAGVADDTAQFGPIKPGFFLAFGGTGDPAYAVADTTNHLLTMTPTANASYDIWLLGRSA